MTQKKLTRVGVRVGESRCGCCPPGAPRVGWHTRDMSWWVKFGDGNWGRIDLYTYNLLAKAKVSAHVLV